MGLLCSKLQAEEKTSDSRVETIRTKFTTTMFDSHADKASSKRLIEVHDIDIFSLNSTSKSNDWLAAIDAGFTSAEKYFQSRDQVFRQEKTLDFDFRCRDRATDLEKRVDTIIQNLKRQDCESIYDSASPQKGFGGQLHKRFPGDHFLTNVDLINKTALLEVARRMPKGAHLHIHFNACLLPHVLLDIAKGMERMFITSDLPLLPDNDYENFDRCEIQFSLKAADKEDPGDLFSKGYRPRQTMRFEEFLERFPENYGKAGDADKWLMDKLVFNDEETHNRLQTAAGYFFL